MKELAIHSNVTCIPQEEFEKFRGYWYYASYELNKTLQMLKEVQQEFNEDGSPIRFRKATEYTFTKEQVQDMESNLRDLEYRLRKMFVVDEEKSERMRERHRQGKIPVRGPRKDRIKRRVR